MRLTFEKLYGTQFQQFSRKSTHIWRFLRKSQMALRLPFVQREPVIKEVGRLLKMPLIRETQI